MSISTHILDITLGRPAAHISVTLARFDKKTWTLINDSHTDVDGRCKDLLPPRQSLEPGTYRIHFDTAAYFLQHKIAGLYPYVEVVFTVSANERNYHIPLLLTANGYTTYRGS